MTWPSLWIEGDGGGVTGEKAAKPMTAVRYCVSTFVSLKQVDVFDEGPRYVILRRRDTTGYFWGEFHSRGCGEKTGILS